MKFVCQRGDMALSLVPEHLRKPELVFEVTARGQQAQSDVKGLRVQLRGCLAQERSWQDSFDLEEEILACKTRLEELEDDLVDASLALAGSARAKLASQILHWRARMELLAYAPAVTTEVQEWAKTATEKLKLALEVLNESKSVKEKGASFVDHAKDPSLSLHIPSPKASAESTKSAPASSSAPPVFEKSVTNQVFENKTALGNESVVRPFSMFAKLPHPLSAILQNIPRVDGLDLNALLAFLQETFRVRDFPGMTDSAVMEILTSYCLRPLSDRLLDCLKRGVSFDTFHAEVLDYFVPTRVMERLRVERVYRPQAPGEMLSQYVGEIRSLAQVLRLNFSEGQLVDLIVEGIKPQDRSRFVFCAKPTTFAELDRLSRFSSGIQDCDFQRNLCWGQFPPVPLGPQVAFVQPGPPVPNTRKEPPVCFGCRQKGHVKRNCPQAPKKDSEPKN